MLLTPLSLTLFPAAVHRGRPQRSGARETATLSRCLHGGALSRAVKVSAWRSAELLIELVVRVPGCKPILLVRDEFAQQLSI